MSEDEVWLEVGICLLLWGGVVVVNGSERDGGVEICSMAVRKGTFNHEMAHLRRN